MKVNIKGKEIELKQTIRSLIIYENVTGKSFSPSSIQDILTYLFCVVVASAKDYSLSFDDFIDYVDENPNTLEEFIKWIEQQNSTNEKIKKK